ncbi:hypothetical protein P4O66_000956 [Electrophorus voltai]|uniref:Ig-like domain-containing protein n=1 Tax=Electrophorus voltai TaxID=2609070 RepID=A0AAD8ZD48_9TELE|nr:hypothetical protein P4O66_000956 [Electrophorus voltai]
MKACSSRAQAPTPKPCKDKKAASPVPAPEADKSECASQDTHALKPEQPPPHMLYEQTVSPVNTRPHVGVHIQKQNVKVHSDSGIYTCRGERKSDSQSSETSNAVSLTVSILPRAILTVEPQGSVFTGESVTLKCEIEFYNLWRYHWYNASSMTAASCRLQETNTYTISSVAAEEQYWCRGERQYRPLSSQKSNSVHLSVEVSPKAVVILMPDKQVFRGETVTLGCNIQGEGDNKWTYGWYKHGYKLNSCSTSRQCKTGSVTEADSGKYTCTGQRSDSQCSESSNAVTLNISSKPQVLLSVFPQSWLTDGASVTLTYEMVMVSPFWKSAEQQVDVCTGTEGLRSC